MLNASLCAMDPGRLELQHTHGLEACNPRLNNGVRIYLHINDKLWVSIREAGKFILVQVHDEELIRGSQFHGLSGELFVEVGGVPLVLLPNGKQTHEHSIREKKGTGPRRAR